MLHLNHEILLSGKPILKVTISYLTGSFQRSENNLIKDANVLDIIMQETQSAPVEQACDTRSMLDQS